MTMLPFSFDIFGFRRPNRLTDQHFGVTLTPDDLLTAVPAPILTESYYRPWRPISSHRHDTGSIIKSDKDMVQINLDVQHFTPEEITVKTGDGYVVVEGKHEEKKDEHGHIRRHFVRRYILPEGTLPESVESTISSDGVLTIKAPKKMIDCKGERKVPISQTGPVRKEIKNEPNGPEKDEKEK